MLLQVVVVVVFFFFQNNAFSNLSLAKGPLNTPLVFFKLTFFSISTATLCGEYLWNLKKLLSLFSIFSTSVFVYIATFVMRWCKIIQ